MNKLLRYPLRYHRRAKDLVRYWKMFTFKRYEYNALKVCRVDRADYLLAAKRLHTAVYLHRGFINEKDVVEGILSQRSDPHQTHADYFVVIDPKHEKVLATARQIKSHPDKKHQSFPMIENVQLYKDVARIIYRHDAIDCVEISGLAKNRNASSFTPLLLYRAMWHHSLYEQHKLWLMACDVRLYEKLKLLFGGAIRRAGPVTHYPGGDVVPAVLNVQRSVSELRRAVRRAPKSKRHVRRHAAHFLLHNIPVEALNVHERRAYEEFDK